MTQSEFAPPTNGTPMMLLPPSIEWSLPGEVLIIWLSMSVLASMMPKDGSRTAAGRDVVGAAQQERVDRRVVHHRIGPAIGDSRELLSVCIEDQRL